ncbi:AEC family transporter [Clostridium oceanicum]|uniref:AEC family transporter n=1 Tax=Clostridium oceanicum TaxID=1543 RepID=A0ABN1JCM3_9CLOT
MNIMEIVTKIATDSKIVGAIASSVLIILFGYFLRKKEVFKDSTSKIVSEVVLSAALPALAYNSFMKDIDGNALKQAMNLLIWGFIMYVLLIIITKVLYVKFKGDKKEVLRVLTIFGSTTFFGIPITQAVYGATGVMYASILNISYRAFLYSYGYVKMSGLKMDKENIKKIIFNPIVLATLFGMIIWVVQKSLPQVTITEGGKTASYAFLRIDKTAVWLHTPLTYLAKLCSPLAWLAIGCKLAKISLKEAVSSKECWYYTLTKVILVPALNIVALYLLTVTGILQFSHMALATVVIAMATPTATVAAAFSISFDKEALTTSNCSFLSTIFSIVLMPIWIVVLEVIKQLGMFA